MNAFDSPTSNIFVIYISYIYPLAHIVIFSYLGRCQNKFR